MGIIKKTTAVFVLLVMVFLTGCSSQRTALADSLKTTYNSETDFYQYCDSADSYMIKLNMRNCYIQVVLEKKDETWAGHLSLYESERLVESIPISIADDKIVIQSDNEKRIDLDSLLLYNINTENGKIRKVDPSVWGLANISEIEIDFDPQTIADYMISFYNNFISELTSFEYKDLYFNAINNFQSALYREQHMQNRDPYHSLSIGFKGNKAYSWNPGYGSFGDVCMILTETSPIAW